MVSLKYFLLAAVSILASAAGASAQLPPVCSINFKPNPESLTNNVVVKGLGPNEYHVELESPHAANFDRNFPRSITKTLPVAKIECTSNYVMDFEFEGVEAIQYFRVSKSRRSSTDGSQVLSQHTAVSVVLAANATGTYSLYSRDSPVVRTSYFVFAQTERYASLLGRGRILAGTVNQNNVIIPCVSSNPWESVYLFRKQNNRGIFVPVPEQSFQFDRKTGFVLQRKTKANELFGEYRCTTDQRNPNSEGFVVVNVEEHRESEQTSHPQLYINLLRDGGAECIGPAGSRPQLVKLHANPFEAPTLVNCFKQRNKACGSVAQNPVNGISESRYSSSTIKRFAESSGLLVCFSESEIVHTLFIRALDGVYYKRVTEVGTGLLLRITIEPNVGTLLGGSQITIGSEEAAGAFYYDPRIYSVRYKNGSVYIIGETRFTDKPDAIKLFLTTEATDIIVEDVLAQTGRTITIVKPLRVTRRQCERDEFRCDSEECIGADERCDHVIDCADGHSDEINCSNLDYTRACTSSEFKCSSGQCVPEYRVCDQKFDCFDRSDEQNCEVCPPMDHFRCRNGECILKSYVCDSDKDCSDNSDEDVNICYNCNNDADKFKCNTGNCITRDRVCDGVAQCPDQSDEDSEACHDFVPRIVNSRSSYTFVQGEDSFLVCEVRIPASAASSPRLIPTVEWTAPFSIAFEEIKKKKIGRAYNATSYTMVKGLKESYEAEFTFFYRLPDFESYQTGVYTCLARNEAGYVRRQLTVGIQDCLDSGPAPTNKPGRPSRPEDAYPEEEPELGVDHEVEEDQYVCYEAGKFSDLYSCGVFHECVTDGKHLNHYRFQCAPGTTYCPDTKMCGWERDCPCNERKRVKNKNQLNLKNLKHN